MTLNNFLVLSLFFVLFIAIFLGLLYLYLILKEKNTNVKKSDKKDVNISKNKVKQNYNVQSVFDFIEFDKVEDNMIIQKKGKRFLMAIECQGVNYDLMSEVEKTAVETGFLQFLNTLREPIQIYVQSRTVNLEQNLGNYKVQIQQIEEDLRKKEQKFKELVDKGSLNEKQTNMMKYEIIRMKNLLDYGRDIVANTERMSFNKNILRKKYYIIISYYYSENNTEEFLDPSEIKDMAFSELYTKAQTLIRTLSTTGVVGHIANSYELVDLLYNAYNKDEAECYGVNRALLGGFDELYVTSQDVYVKKIKALDKKIEEESMKLAEKAVLRAKTNMEKIAEEKEESMEELIQALAKQLIDDNKKHLGTKMTKLSIESVDEIQKEEKNNGKKIRKTRKSNK